MAAHARWLGGVTLGSAARALLCTLAATLAAKLLVEGAGSLPPYCPRRGVRTLGEPQATAC